MYINSNMGSTEPMTSQELDEVLDGKIILRWQNHRCPKSVWRLHTRISHQLCALYGSKKTLYHTKSRHHILSPRESNSSLGARTENNLSKKLSSPDTCNNLVRHELLIPEDVYSVLKKDLRSSCTRSLSIHLRSIIVSTCRRQARH